MADQRKLKKIAQRRHFCRRAYERLGYELSAAELRDIRRQITQKDGTLITQPSSRLTLWRVVVNGRTMVVVYDCDTDEFATIMSEAVWQAQNMQNSPHVSDRADLRGSLADTPAGQALAALKGGD